MTENYDNFLSELGYKRKPKSFQVKKTKKKIDVKTPDESIHFLKMVNGNSQLKVHQLKQNIH